MKISDEELLKLLETAEEAEGPIEYTNNVIPFLTKYNIVPGEEEVPASILYKLYREFTREPVERHLFIRYINEILVEKGDHRKPYYTINLSAMRISKEYYKLLCEKEKKQTYKHIQHIRNFIEMYELEDGDNWVISSELYMLYRLRFLKTKKRAKLSIEQFVQQMKVMFNYKYDEKKRGYWFAVNEKYKELISPEDKKRLEQSREKKGRYKGNKRTKTIKKRSSQTSVSTSGLKSEV